jgi:hypothetical protein
MCGRVFGSHDDTSSVVVVRACLTVPSSWAGSLTLAQTIKSTKGNRLVIAILS